MSVSANDIMMRLGEASQTVLAIEYMPMLGQIAGRIAEYNDLIAEEAFDNFISPYNQEYLGTDEALDLFQIQLNDSTHAEEYLAIVRRFMNRSWTSIPVNSVAMG